MKQVMRLAFDADLLRRIRHQMDRWAIPETQPQDYIVPAIAARLRKDEAEEREYAKSRAANTAAG
jgi:hypothetical protein